MSEPSMHDTVAAIKNERSKLSLGLLAVDLLNNEELPNSTAVSTYNTLVKYTGGIAPRIGLEDDEMMGPVKETTSLMAIRAIAELIESYGNKLCDSIPYSKSMVETAFAAVTTRMELGQALDLLTKMDKSEADRIKGMSDEALSTASKHMPKPSTKHNDNIAYVTNEKMVFAYQNLARTIVGVLSTEGKSVIEKCHSLDNIARQKELAFGSFMDVALEVLPNRRDGEDKPAIAVFRSTDNYSYKAFIPSDTGFETATRILDPDSNDVVKDDAERASKVREIIDGMSDEENVSMSEVYTKIGDAAGQLANAVRKFIKELEEHIESNPEDAIANAFVIRDTVYKHLYEPITAFHFFYDIVKGSGMRLLQLVENTRK